jgi:hypothetical protein
MIALAGEGRRWEPKRLRLRIFAVAGRLAASGRRLRLRLAERWPGAGLPATRRYFLATPRDRREALVPGQA